MKKKELVKTKLKINIIVFMVYITFLLIIYQEKKAKITFFFIKKTKILKKYLYYVNVF